MGGGGSNIYDEQGSAGGSAEISAAHPTPSFIPPPLSPYHILLANALMERDEDMEEAEMDDRETENRGVESKHHDQQGSAGGSAEISLDISIRLIENRIQCDPPFLSIPTPLLLLPQIPLTLRHQRNTKSGVCP